MSPVCVPTTLELSSPDGSPVTLGDVLAGHRLTVVQLVRYFGCLPCQEWLVELDRASAELAERGVAVAAVGGSADYQASWLQQEKGVTMPLLLDPEHRLRDVVGATRPLGWRLLDARGLASYAATLHRGWRPQAITRDTVRTPGVIVLDTDGVVRWSHVGTRIGDYPPLSEVVEVVLSEER